MPKIENEREQEGRERNTLLHEDETFSLGFTQVPNKVLYARNLSAQAKTLYTILLSYSWQEDRCFPGYVRLCEHMNLSEKIVRKYMRELEAVKLLSQKRRGLGKTNIYTLLSLKNATLDLGNEKEQDSSSVSERDTSPVLKRDPSPVEEYEDEEDSFTKTKNSSKNTLKAEFVSAYSHREHMATGKRNGKHTSGRSPTQKQTPTQKRIAKIEEHKHKPTIGKPFTQDEIDEKRRQGKNASGLSPLAGIIPPDHWQELETKSGKSSNGNGHDNHYNNSTQNSPVFIDAVIEQFSTLLGDEPENIPININRAAKLYRETGMEEDAFRDMLHQALGQAKRYPSAKIKKQRSDGRPNRMPVFFTILEERLAR